MDAAHQDPAARLRAAVAGAIAEARAAGLDWPRVAAELGVSEEEVRRIAEGGAPTATTTTTAAEWNETRVDTPEVERSARGSFHSGSGEQGGPPLTHRVGPVTFFTEMDALEAAGRRGWRVVGAGTATYVVVKTDVQWEFRRVLASRATGRALLAEGWERIGTSWFPWGYYQRATGEPALPDDVVAGYAVEP